MLEEVLSYQDGMFELQQLRYIYVHNGIRIPDIQLDGYH